VEARAQRLPAGRERRLGLRLVTLCVAAAAPAAAFAAGLRFEDAFSDRGEPRTLHYQVEFSSGGVQHRLAVWRDGARRLKRRTDDAVETYAFRAPSEAEFRMSVLDLRRRIHTRVDRTNLYRVGNFSDWFDLAHGLKYPKTTYHLVSGRPPDHGPKAIGACRWYDLAQERRVTHVCWSTTHRIPLLIEEGGAVVWRVTAVDLKPMAARTFDIHDEGFVRNDANEDIERD
jgi:hypothetical protein